MDITYDVYPYKAAGAGYIPGVTALAAREGTVDDFVGRMRDPAVRL